MPRFSYEIHVTFVYTGELSADDEEAAREEIEFEGADTFGVERGHECQEGVQLYLTPIEGEDE